MNKVKTNGKTKAKANAKRSVMERFPELWQPVSRRYLTPASCLYAKLMTMDPSSQVYFDSNGSLCHDKDAFSSLDQMWKAARSPPADEDVLVHDFMAAVRDSEDKTSWASYPFHNVAIRRRRMMLFVCIQGNISSYTLQKGKEKAAVLHIARMATGLSMKELTGNIKL